MKKIPKFKNEAEENEFWANNDSSEFIDWSKANKVSFHQLKPTAKSISLRLPETMLYNIKQEAHKLDIPYQSLLKIFISEGLESRRKINIVN